MIDFSVEPPVRRSARLVILSPARRILLFDTDVPSVDDPMRQGSTRFWGTPGGGVEAGETFVEAAARELREETGIVELPIGPWVWKSNRVVQFDDGRSMRFIERYYLIEADSEFVDRSQIDGIEKAWIRGHKWWSTSCIDRSDATFAPGHIGLLVQNITNGRMGRIPTSIDQPL